MIFGFEIDVILESLSTLLAATVTIIATYSKDPFNKLAPGFIFLMVSTMFDLLDEFVENIIIDSASKIFLIIGLILIATTIHKIIKESPT